MRRVLVTGGSGFIGTNLVEALRRRGDCVLNVDNALPVDVSQKESWRAADILNGDQVIELTRKFAPEIIFHAAGRTDLHGGRALDYRVNVEGTENVLQAAASSENVRLVVVFSSMLVCRLGYVPSTDNDYCPSSAYGESKVALERYVRAQEQDRVAWVIVRPTSIWGPWFQAPYRDFFLAVARKRFRLPRRWGARRSLGFVGNTVHQLLRIAESPVVNVRGRTFYLCDYAPVLMRDWAVEVARALVGSAPKEVSTPILRGAAWVGDGLKWVGIANPPLTTFRLNNMLTDAVFDTAALQAVCGALPYSTEQGIGLTVDWMKRRSLI